MFPLYTVASGSGLSLRHRYAAKALAIVPHSADIYYWLIHAIHKQGHTEIARSELRTAKHRLLEEDYILLGWELQTDDLKRQIRMMLAQLMELEQKL